MIPGVQVGGKDEPVKIYCMKQNPNFRSTTDEHG